MSAQKGPGRLDGDELVMLPGAPGSGQQAALDVKPARERGEGETFRRGSDLGMAGNVEANFEAAGVKRLCPVQRIAGGEIMPLDAVTGIVKTALQLAPTGAERPPDLRLRKRRETIVVV
jgi:hypothetical protein